MGTWATGLSLSQAADVLEVVGAVDAAVRERAYQLGGTIAATLMECASDASNSITALRNWGGS